jgi:hypothetical protein
MTADLGPCFTCPPADPAACRHPVDHRFAWYARDDTAKSGHVLCVVCMACDTVLATGDPAPRVAPPGEAKQRKGRKRKA